MFGKETRQALRDAQTRLEALEAENRSYSDIVTQALVDAATSPTSDAYVSALETAAGQLSRAFASAGVSGSGAGPFNPWVMAQIGRSLVEAGEAIWYRTGRALTRAEDYGLMPNGQYQLSANGISLTLPSDRVMHVRWNVDVASKRGLSPLGAARTLRQLLQRLEGSLAAEGNAAVGYLLPVPAGGDSKVVEQLKEDLGKLNGNIAVAETTQGGWGDSSAAPRRDFQLARLGPDYPDSNVMLFVKAREAVLSACGFPVPLATDADGTGQREAWRRYLHGTVAPLGRLVATEAERIGLPITVAFDELFASDIQGRARAFQSLVGGGMDIAAAAAASGLLTPED